MASAEGNHLRHRTKWNPTERYFDGGWDIRVLAGSRNGVERWAAYADRDIHTNKYH